MEIRIKDEFIKLGQALKLAGVVEDGVEAKYAINDGLVLVNGEVIAKANDQEQLLTCDIDLNEVKKVRNNINYLSLRRPEQYETF